MYCMIQGCMTAQVASEMEHQHADHSVYVAQPLQMPLMQ
jgi:hypothetical protein